LTQTTLAVEETAEVIDALRLRFPTLSDPPSDDICYATTNRQRAVQSILCDCDVLLVVGSQNSSNSQRLVEIAQRRGVAAHLINGPDDINEDWLTGATTIGVTAGASAPPELVDAVIDALGARGPITVSEHSVAIETARFTLPKQVRTS
jgi:4-hydroxy-3-methylbut-2-enyl diphosphate reductase